MAVDTQKKDKGGRRTMLFVRDQTRLKYTATTIDKMVFEAGVSHALRVPRYALGEYHDEYVASAAKRRLRLRPTCQFIKAGLKDAACPPSNLEPRRLCEWMANELWVFNYRLPVL